MAQAPCKGCTFRQIGCHSRCEKYMKFQAANEAEKMARRIQQAVYGYFIECQERVSRTVREHKRRCAGRGNMNK